MQYAETRWQELKAQIDAIDSIPELQEQIRNTRDRNAFQKLESHDNTLTHSKRNVLKGFIQ